LASSFRVSLQAHTRAAASEALLKKMRRLRCRTSEHMTIPKSALFPRDRRSLAPFLIIKVPKKLRVHHLSISLMEYKTLLRLVNREYNVSQVILVYP